MAWIVFVASFMMFAWAWHLDKSKWRKLMLWVFGDINLIAQITLWVDVYLTKQWTTWVWMNLIVIGVPLAVVIAALLIVLFVLALVLFIYTALSLWVKFQLRLERKSVIRKVEEEYK